MSDEAGNLVADLVRFAISLAPQAIEAIEAIVKDEKAKRVGEVRERTGAPIIADALADLERKADE